MTCLVCFVFVSKNSKYYVITRINITPCTIDN